MNAIITFYIANTTLLLLHEIDSAYQKEWEILNLPGEITGFLLLHIPIIALLLCGIILIEKATYSGLIFGLITGVCGLIPFLIHKIFFKRITHFNSFMSNSIIYLNIISGSILAGLCLNKIIV